LIAAPVLGSITERFLEGHTRIQEVVVACAAVRYRRAHNSFPQKLDELVPEWLPSLPIDVMDGRPLRYRLNEDDSRDIWSVGLNRLDDGGIEVPGVKRAKQPDWLWHMPVPKPLVN
jgi:hypothetical protein